MLKRKIDKKSYDELAPAIRDLYEKEGDEFILQAEREDVSALKSAKEHEKSARQAAEKELRDLRDAEDAKIRKATEKAREAALAEARENSDLDALEKSWKAKYNDLKESKDAEIKLLNGATKKITVTSIAENMAKEISTAPALLQERIEGRLTVDLVDGTFVTKVVDAQGQPSASTVDELRKEFIENPAYKMIIKAGEASGGGANNLPGGGANDKPFSDMSPVERTALKKSNPERFKELSDESRKGQLNPI